MQYQTSIQFVSICNRRTNRFSHIQSINDLIFSDQTIYCGSYGRTVMPVRSNARERGASPLEIEHMVHSFKPDID